jgi:ATP-binding cassette subfamily C protein CydD
MFNEMSAGPTPAASVAAAVVQRRLFRLAAEARGALAIMSFGIVVGAAGTIGQMVLASHLIVSAFPSASSPGTPGALVRPLVWLLVLVGLRASGAGLTEWAAGRIATGVKSRLRRELVAGLIARGPRGLADERTGEVVTTAMDGIEKLDAFYRRFVTQAAATAFVPIIILAAVVAIDPLTAIVLAITGPLIPVFMWLLGSLAARRTREQWGALSLLGGRFLDTLQGLPTLTLFGRAEEAASALVESSEQLRVKTMAVLRVAFLSGFVLELTASVSTAVVAATVGVRLIGGWLAFEPGLAALMLAPEFYLPFRQLGQRHHAGMEGVAAAGRLFALLDATPARAAAPSGNAGHEPVAEPCPVVVDGVSFSYSAPDAPALREVTLELRPGTVTAIVGPSGAGKSSLVGVLMRFLQPDSGRLLLNGRDSREIDVAAWRRHIALVPQRPRFFEGSILDNLRIGRPDASIGDVVDAARLAQADGFISALRDGYASHLDESASTLSAGERQRLAIARALLKRAPILVLDEPTSNLDAESEASIAASLALVAAERTVLIVAHRMHTIRHADTIVVLDGGRVVESGSHARLCRNERAYARLLHADCGVA